MARPISTTSNHKLGRRDSRVWYKERAMIIEESMYLVSLGYKEDKLGTIISGIEIAVETYGPGQWINICEKTLRWHIRNFYMLGKGIKQ